MWEILSAILQQILVSAAGAGVQAGIGALNAPSGPSGSAGGGGGGVGGFTSQAPPAGAGGAPTRPGLAATGFSGLPPMSVSGNVLPSETGGFQGLGPQQPNRGGFEVPRRGGI